MKYALVVLCALLVGCGGLTKEQQGDAYLGAAEKVNAAWDNAEVKYRSAIENSYSESTDLEAITNFYSAGSAADLDFIKNNFSPQILTKQLADIFKKELE